MAIKPLDRKPLTDADADRALAVLPPIPDNVLIALRNIQAQLDALSARITALGG